MSKPKVLPQYVAGLSAAFGAFCLGASIGWTAPVETAIKEGGYGFEVSSNEWGWISSLLTLGATIVCIPAGFLIGVFGRKPTMLALTPTYMVGWVLVIFAKNVTMLYFGRLILGISGGAFCVTAPMYTTEIAQLELRGTMGSFFQLLIVNGILYAYIIGAFVDFRTLNIVCAVLPIIFVVFFSLMPESPVYLAQKGREESARKSLLWLRGQDYDVSDELNAMIADGKKQAEQKVNVWAALKRPITMKGVSIAVLLQVFQQWTGINAILFYATSIFEDAGTGIDGSICTIIVGATMVVTTFVAVAIIDKAGRRVLLMVSSFFMIINTALVGVYFMMKSNDPSSVESLGWLPVSSVCIFIVFFSIGFGPVPWLVMAELFSEDIKSVAGSIAGTSNWLSAFLVTLLFPIFRDSFGAAATFWIFTVVAVIAFFYSMFIVPETKGKTLAEIQDLLAGKSDVAKKTTEETEVKEDRL